MTPEEMQEWAKKNRKFVKIKDGETIKARLVNTKVVADQNDPDKEKMRYYLRLEDGSTKSLDSANTSLADTMSEFLDKDIIITREGEGNQTKYRVALDEQ